MRKLKGSGAKTAIIVIVAVLVTALVVGLVVYLWQQNKFLKNQAQEAAVTPLSAPTREVQTPDPAPVTTRDMDVEGDSPTDITERFMMRTLGTLPGASVDYASAKQLASQNLLSQWTDDSFVPQFYGIQDGPTVYEMTTQTITGDAAVVKVEVRWGEMGLAWMFGLVQEGGEWKVDSLRDDAQ